MVPVLGRGVVVSKGNFIHIGLVGQDSADMDAVGWLVGG